MSISSACCSSIDAPAFRLHGKVGDAMSNQLHRRLAYRTGGGGTDTTSDSFWDSTDFSTVHVVSSMELYRKQWYRTGDGRVSNPYVMAQRIEQFFGPSYGCPDALFLTGGTDPIIMFGEADGGRATNAARLYMSQLFRVHDFTGIGDRLAANQIAGNVRRVSLDPMYAEFVNPTTASHLLSGTVARDVSGVHWYFVQTRNTTGNFFKRVGYIPLDLESGTHEAVTTIYNHERRGGVNVAYDRVTIPTDYGIRIIHAVSPNGGFPLEAETISMFASQKPPGTYQYYQGETATTATTNNSAAAIRVPSVNRELWDFTLAALETGDMSPAGYFTDNVPIWMQCVDSGQKMVFLSTTTSSGQALSIRTMSDPWSVRTLSTTTTSRAMTDFTAIVNAELGLSYSRFCWTWFKFSTDGKKLIMMTCDGVLAKFLLSTAYDLSTMTLQTAVRLLAQDDTAAPSVMFSVNNTMPSTYVGTAERLRQPIIASDIDLDGLSLIISVGRYRQRDTSNMFPPYSNRIVQYRL